MDNPKQKAIKEKGAALRLRLSNTWQNFRERMHHKHRIVVMDTDTFKETFSAELTGVNIFTYVGITVIVMLILASLLIAFTPLRGLVPGFIKPELREETIRNARTIDSLELVIDQHEQHIRIIQDVINGKKLYIEQDADRILVSKNGEALAVYEKEGDHYRCLRGLL